MNINEELKNILEWVICIIIAVVLGLWIRYYIMTPTQVQSVSMKPTLIESQRLILNRTIRLTHKLPERGDIITFEAPTEDYLTEAEFKESPTARYEEPENKFVHNVLEIGKVSYIKRVIALPGEHVKIQNGKVYINGELYKEDIVSASIEDPGVAADEVKLGDDEYFVLGDNRNSSEDSRMANIGNVKKDYIIGKAWFHFKGFGKMGLID